MPIQPITQTNQKPRKSLLELDDEIFGGVSNSQMPTSTPQAQNQPRRKSLLELDDEMYGGKTTISQKPSAIENALNNPIVSGLEKVGTKIGNFGVGVAKGVMDAPRLAAQGGSKLGGMLSQALTGQQPSQPTQQAFSEATKPISYATPSNPTQQAGYNVEKMAEFFVPGPGAASKGAGLVSKVVRSGTDAGVRTLAQGEDAKTAALNAGIGGAGEVAAKGMGLLGKYLAPSLRKSAEKGYSKVLNPTTNENKAITQKVVPELLDRGQWGWSRESMEKEFNKLASKAGNEIGKKIDEIPKNSTVNTYNILSRLDDVKQQFMVDGPSGPVAADVQAVKHIDDLQDQLKQMSSNVGAGSYAPFESVRKFRQILDRSVSDAKGFYGKTLAEGSLTNAKKEAANAIRAELSKEYPDLAKINAEYNFWSNAQKVLEDTIARKTGQARPLVESLRRGAGAVAGGTVGGPAGAIAGDIVVGGLSQLIDSTAWRTLGSLQKSRIAKLIGDGQLEEASKYITRLMTGYNAKGGN